MSTKERQQETLKRLGPYYSGLAERYGYTEVSASFNSSPELTLDWDRHFTEGGVGLSVEFPDYLDDAPLDALSDMTEAVMKYVVGRKGMEIPGSMESFIHDPSFAYRRQSMYLRRTKKFTDEDIDRIKDAQDSLIEKGLIHDVKNVEIRWLTNRNAVMPEVHTSMRVVGLPVLATACEDFPDEVCEYMIWSSIAKLRYPRAPKADPRIQALLNSYPSRNRIEKVLVDNKLKI